MTTATRRLEAVPAELSDQAAQVRFGQVAATVITAFFYAIGWIVGASWRAVVYCCLAVRYGYRAGAKVPVAAAAPPPAQ